MSENKPRRPLSLTYWVEGKREGYENWPGIELTSEELYKRRECILKEFESLRYPGKGNFDNLDFENLGIVKIAKEGIGTLAYIIQIISETRSGLIRLTEKTKLPYSEKEVSETSINGIL